MGWGINIIGGNLLYFKSTDCKHYADLQNTFTVAPRLVFDQIAGHHSQPSWHIIDHHTGEESILVQVNGWNSSQRANYWARLLSPRVFQLDKEDVGDVEGRSRIANAHIVGVPERVREKKNEGGKYSKKLLLKFFQIGKKL